MFQKAGRLIDEEGAIIRSPTGDIQYVVKSSIRPD